MFNPISLRFSVLDSKVNKSGFAPLTLTIIVNGERTRLHLSRKLKPNDFNTKKQISTDPEVNDFISVVTSKVLQIHTQLLANNEPTTAEIIKSKFFVKDTSK